MTNRVFKGFTFNKKEQKHPKEIENSLYGDGHLKTRAKVVLIMYGMKLPLFPI
jgi:hypothetical protein